MSEENIENIANWDSNFAPIFLDHHLLPDINFNGNFLINNISIPKKVINLYISYKLRWLSYMVKKLKCRFYIRQLLIWICKAN